MLYAHAVRLSIAVFAFGSAPVFAQNFPTKPLRIITSAPGGTSDFTSRLIARGLTESLGQQVIVDNRGNFGGEVIARATPDGYTMMVDGPSLWLIPLLQKSPYDPLRDLAPVSLAVRAPNVLIVSPSVAATSVKELVALAKAKPGQLNFGTGGIGNSGHLVGELFKSATGANIVSVHYKGTGPALNALMAGEVQIMFANATIAIPQIKAGKVRTLAVATLQPSPLLPDVPTLAASGLPIEATITQGIVAPARTPAVLVSRLSQEIARVLNRPEIKDRHFSIGVETVGSSPEEFGAVIKADTVKWGKVIKDLGIRAD